MNRKKNPKGLSLLMSRVNPAENSFSVSLGSLAVSAISATDSFPAAAVMPTGEDTPTPTVASATSRILEDSFSGDATLLQPTRFPLEDLYAIWMSLSQGTQLPTGYHVTAVSGIAEVSDGMQSGMNIQTLRIWRGDLYQTVVYKKASGSDIRLHELIARQAKKSQVVGVAPLYGANLTDDPNELSACMMPFIAGGNLKKYWPVIRACLRGEQSTLQQGAVWFLLECVAQIAKTLSFLHTIDFDDSHIPYATLRDGQLEHITEPRPASPMVHCDLKESNVLIDLDTAPPNFHLIDFGSTRSVRRLSTDDKGYEGGSARYFSPARWVSLAEDLSGYLGLNVREISKSLNSTAYDIWALGLMLAEALDIDSQSLFALDECSRIDAMSTAVEYLSGKRYIAVEKQPKQWSMVWKLTSEGHPHSAVDTKAFQEERQSCVDLTTLLCQMLSVQTQCHVKSTQNADVPSPLFTTAADIAMSCQTLLTKQQFAQSEKEAFLKYLKDAVHEEDKAHCSDATRLKREDKRSAWLNAT